MNEIDWTIDTPDGSCGPWSIETFEIDERAASFSRVRAVVTGNRFEVVEAGTYRRLVHRTRGVVMSNTRMEKSTNTGAWMAARGHVLINGLGLGMLLGAILRKPEVEFVRVIEIDPDVISLVGPTFAGRENVEIVQADALAYRPEKAERYTFAWHDIWDFTGPDMLPTMAALKRKWARRVGEQKAWTEKLARYHARRYA